MTKARGRNIGSIAFFFCSVLAYVSAQVPPAYNSTTTNVTRGEFFSVRSVRLLTTTPLDKFGIWGGWSNIGHGPHDFEPCLEVKVGVKADTESSNTFAKAYFYVDGKMVLEKDEPDASGFVWDAHKAPMPTLFQAQEDPKKPNRFFFEVPKNLKSQEWSAIVVFGDQNEVQSAPYPAGSGAMLDYPERQRVEQPTAAVTRQVAANPLIKYIAKTKNRLQPEITLFLRIPPDIHNAGELKGVLAVCVVANNVDFVERDLQKEEMSGDYSGLFQFADAHHLAVLAWGSRKVWDSGTNDDEMPPDQEKGISEGFDLIATGWEEGVHQLAQKYGLPEKDYLLWGNCASAQWVHRLCLDKPDHFFAIYIHNSGSFARPTPAASKVLWCVTTGELYGGYGNSLKFVAECQKLNYPMIYKAIPGLGHSDSPVAKDLSFKFFDLALSLKDQRDQLQKTSGRQDAWLDAFRNPPFYGDYMNQDVFPASQVEMIDPENRTPLPTSDIAQIWGRATL